MTAIEKAIQLLESAGYTVIKKLSPEEQAIIDQRLADFEASNEKFPDELFQEKGS